jgi:hypothetical protein
MKNILLDHLSAEVEQSIADSTKDAARPLWQRIAWEQLRRRGAWPRAPS